MDEKGREEICTISLADMRIRGVSARAALPGPAEIGCTIGIAIEKSVIATVIINWIIIRLSVASRIAIVGFFFRAATGCGGGVGGLLRQYEDQEDVYLALDGSATVYINSSIAALNALHGTSFDTSPIARVKTRELRDYFTTPAAHVTRVATSLRHNRRFVHVRIDVDDIRRLSEDAGFRSSTYVFTRNDSQVTYRQVIGAAAAKDVGDVGWTGGEKVV